MPRPPLPHMPAVALEIPDQGGEAGIAGMAGRGEPEPAQHGPGFRLPFQVHLAGPGRGEHPAHQVALGGRQRGPVGEQFPGRGIGRQHIPAAALHDRRVRLQALHQVRDPWIEPFGGFSGSRVAAAGFFPVPAAVGEDPEIVPFGWRKPERGGQRVHHLCRRPDRAPLLKERVVGDGHAGQQGDFLAAQPGGAAAAAGGQPDVGGAEAGAAFAEQFAQRVRVTVWRHTRSLPTPLPVTRCCGYQCAARPCWMP